jgi:hypothetical protein
VPVGGGTVNYQILKGSGSLSSSGATSDLHGFGSTTLHLAALSGDVLVSACVAPGNKPCQNFSATAVPPSRFILQPVGGSVQVLSVGQNFQRVAVRVCDSAIPPHPVFNAIVTFQLLVSRLATDASPISIGGIVITRNPAPVIVSSSQVSVTSDAAGVATLQPSTGSTAGALVQGTPRREQALSPSAFSHSCRRFLSRRPRRRLCLAATWMRQTPPLMKEQPRADERRSRSLPATRRR